MRRRRVQRVNILNYLIPPDRTIYRVTDRSMRRSRNLTREACQRVTQYRRHSDIVRHLQIDQRTCFLTKVSIIGKKIAQICIKDITNH